MGAAMRTPNEYFRRLAQRAMETHRLSERGLARLLGCGWDTVNHLLNEETVRMTQEQVFNLMALGGAFKKCET